MPALRIAEEFRCALLMGHVGRDTFIRSFRPSKRLAALPNNEKLEPELATRDELFALQSRLVNLLDSVPMYESVKDALEKYSISIGLTPIAGQPEFVATFELSDYHARTLKNYPVLFDKIDLLLHQGQA